MKHPLHAWITALLILVSSSGPIHAQSAEETDLLGRMVLQVTQQESTLVAIRHDLHQHPELSGQEERTAGLVRRRLEALGFAVRSGVGGHGVVGVLQGGQPGPMVAFRADMDAVRSAAPDPVAYRSLTPGVRHICGHDLHTTIGLGLAEGFAAVQETLPGTVMLVFQPAEEQGYGAKEMLADGVFDPGHPEAIFAVHTAPYPVGVVATAAGGMMTGRAWMEVTVRGTGDVAAAAAQVRQTLAGVGTLPPQRAVMPAPKGFILVQILRGGEGPSANEAVVRAQVMTAGIEDRDRAKAKMLAALEALDLPGITLETAYDERFMEGVNNDAALTALSQATIEAELPDVTVQTVEAAIPAFSEDFGSFQALVPGVMYFLGVSNPDAGTVGMPHSPSYVADDAAILVGTRAMLAAMLGRMIAE